MLVTNIEALERTENMDYARAFIILNYSKEKDTPFSRAEYAEAYETALRCLADATISDPRCCYYCGWYSPKNFKCRYNLDKSVFDIDKCPTRRLGLDVRWANGKINN